MERVMEREYWYRECWQIGTVRQVASVIVLEMIQEWLEREEGIETVIELENSLKKELDSNVARDYSKNVSCSVRAY